jgi:hypothetical protein
MFVSSSKALLAGAVLALSVAAPRASAKDVYKPFLDPSIPHHAAILDTLARIEKEPGNATLHNDLGCLVAWDGFWRDALHSFDTAAELDGKDARPLFNAGLVRALRGEWAGARAKFRKAVKVDPGNWQAWWMLGFSQESLGNDDAAVEAYARSLRVDTSLFDPKVNPFAVATRLKSRVLLETYEKRRVGASLAFSNQLAEPARVATFFQAAAKAAAPAAPAPHAEEPGPVVTTVPPAGTSQPPSAQPSTDPSSRRRRPIGERFGRERPGPVEVQPEPARTAPETPEAAPPTPPPTEPGTVEPPKGEAGETAPGPGMPVTRRGRPIPAPMPVRTPDPE